MEQIVREAAGIRPPDERRVPTNEAGLGTYLATPSARRHVGFFELEVEHQHLYDAFQIHYYGPADGLAPILDAVRAGGILLPIEAWELGRRYRGQVPFTEETHAAEVVQLLTTAAGEGLTNNVLVRFQDWSDKGLPGLVTTGGPRPAFEAFEVTSAHLDGATDPERLELGDGIFGYRFKSGDGEVVVAWTNGGSVTADLGLEGSVKVTSITSEESTVVGPIDVGFAPVFVSTWSNAVS